MWLRRAGIGVGLAVVAFGLPALILFGYSHLMESDYFALTYVDVEGLEYLEEQALLDAAEDVGGEHIIDVQPDRLEVVMAQLPFVEDVEVNRKFPDRLHISIDEHQPVAIVVDDGFWLVDETNQVFLELDSTQPDGQLWQLPLVTGLSRADLETDEGQQLLEMGLQVQTLYEQMELHDEQPISEVHVDELLGVTLVVGQTGTEVRLGRDRFQERLEQFEVVQTSLIRRGVDASYVLIDHESDLGRVAVGQRSEPVDGDDRNSGPD